MYSLVLGLAKTALAAATVAAPASHYTVQPGDTLSGIAASHGLAGWSQLYEDNHAVIGANPNFIVPGEVLVLPGPGSAYPAGAPAPVSVTVRAPAREYVREPVREPVAYRATQPSSWEAAGGSLSAAPGSFQSCVISRESGGDAQVTNGSGHYGLYQFSYAAWTGAGGAAADFGHASVAEQDQVFSRAYSLWGTSPWAAYDGC